MMVKEFWAKVTTVIAIPFAIAFVAQALFGRI